MNILGVGGAELFLIIVIMLVVAGPKRMIRWGYVLGLYLGKLRQMWADVAIVLQKEFDEAGVAVEVPKDIPNRQSVNKMLTDVAKPYVNPMKAAMQEIETPIKEVISEAGKPFRESVAEVRSVTTEPIKPEKSKAETQPSFGTWGNSTSSAGEESTETRADSFGSWGERSSTESSNSTQGGQS